MFGIKHTAQELPVIAGKVRADQEKAPKQDLFWQRGQITIDLSTAAGRFELLIYTILSGAKVRRAILDQTFQALREAGLVNSVRLAQQNLQDKEKVKTILSCYYRALTSHVRKVQAIFAAGTTVEQQYAGDIGTLYTVAAGDSKNIIKGVREFAGINLQASWFCREMKLAGVWADLDQAVCLIVDPEIKVPLWYLGFAGVDSYFLRDVPLRECFQALERYFGGDPFPVLIKSRWYCQKGDSSLCKAQCSVFEVCQIRFQKSAGCF